jgi:hypothetical protein
MISTLRSILQPEMTSQPPSDVTPTVLSCDSYVAYVAELLRNVGFEDDVISNRTVSDAERRHVIVSRVVNGYAVPAVCLFGVAGNLLNLLVLTRKRLQRRSNFVFCLPTCRQNSKKDYSL